ncbi:YhdP family phospholipid transporter [Marinomonas atlantica]|uniref:YhdP family phospholipid transporter n=1 Tax=Marinomonas atlantica TaxID=1806668 RepID=UPI0008349458|nr:AsmA-like C-terminal region-containing protein [Marinomonas atlantica]
MRVIKTTFNCAFWVLVATSLLLAGIVLLAKVGLPLVNVYQPQIERNLTQLTGMKVRVGEVFGELNGVNVELRGSGIHVDTAHQASAISIEHLALELDIPRTLLTFSPQFKNLSISGVSLLLHEDGTGNVALKGLAESTKTSGGDSVAISRVLNYAADQQQMSLIDVDVNISSPRFDDLNVSFPATYLIKQFSKTLVRSDIFVNDMNEPVQVRAQISTDLSNFLQQQVVTYVDVPQVTLPLDWVGMDALKSLSSVSLAGQYWLTYQPGKGITAQARNSAFELAFEGQVPLKGQSDWKIKYTPDGVDASINGLRLDDGEHSYQDVRINAEWERKGNRTFVVFNKMNAQIATRLALNFVPKSWRLAKILTGLDPHGEALNASLRIWDESETLRYQYLSNFIDAQVNGYNGIPEVNNVSGLFSLTDTQGGIEFHTDSSQIAFPTLYNSVWDIESAAGEISWARQDKAFVVTGQSLNIQRNGATIQGGFRLEQPLENGVGEDSLALNINAQHVKEEDRFVFLPPNVLSDSLETWLKQSLGRGEVENLDLLLRTGLKKGDQPHVRLAIDAKLDQVTFDKSWPSAKAVAGRVVVDSDKVDVVVKRGVFAGLPVKDLNIVVPLKGSHSGWVEVSGQVSDKANNILTALNQTPLKESVLEPFEAWQIDGRVSGNFAVAVPISNQQDEPEVSIDLALSDNNVRVSQVELPVKVVSGALHYNDQKGLYDTNFSVAALGGHSNIVLSSERLQSGDLAVDGQFDGVFDSKQLANWREAPNPVVSRLQGKASYQATLAIGRSKPGQVDFNVSSDLKGVSFAMPLPLAKRSDEIRPTTVSVTAMQDEVFLDVSSADWLYGKLLIAEGVLQGGNISAFKPIANDTVIKKGIALFGQFTQVDWLLWSPVIAEFTRHDTDIGADLSEEAQALKTELPEWIRSADIIVDKLPINESNELNNVKIAYTRASDGHPLAITSDELNAVLRQTDVGPELYVAYLNWRTQQDEIINVPSVDEVAFQPSIIPSLSLKVDEVYVDNRPYGDWQGRVVNLGDSLRIDDVSTRLPSGQFNGQIYWQGGSQQSVKLTINAKGENARALTKKFSPTPFLTSKNYDIDVSLEWADSLLSFDRSSLNGQIKFQVRDGNFNQVDQLPPFLRLLGIFNVDALAKRLTFDFSDLYEPGTPFDHFSSVLTINDGILITTEPVKVISPTAEITLEGSANLVTEILNERLTATVPISSALPVAGLLLATPQIAGLLFITDKLIGDQLSKVTSIQYKIEGDFSEPTVTAVPYSPIR